MNKEFVKYEQAMALKELGFDEPCMAIYYSKDKSFSWHHHKDHTNDEPALDSGEFNISAPTYSQCFRWFREKHNIDCYIDKNSVGIFYCNEKGYCYTIFEKHCHNATYEEAESACLDKLIEITKNK